MHELQQNYYNNALILVTGIENLLNFFESITRKEVEAVLEINYRVFASWSLDIMNNEIYEKV